MCIFIHDKSQSFLHIARKSPTNPVSNPPNQETMRITWSFNRSFKLRCSQLPTLWPFWRNRPIGRCRNGVMCPFCHLCDRGEKKRRQKVKNARKAALSRGDARHGWPNWRHRHMTRAAGWWIQGAGGPGQMCPKRWSHQDARRFAKNDQKIVHEVWPTEVECKCYKWSRFFGEASQDGYSFNVYCNPPSGKIGWGVFPVPPQDAFQAMRSFLESRSLVVRSDSGCCRFNRATVVSSFSTA